MSTDERPSRAIVTEHGIAELLPSEVPEPGPVSTDEQLAAQAGYLASLLPDPDEPST